MSQLLRLPPDPDPRPLICDDCGCVRCECGDELYEMYDEDERDHADFCADDLRAGDLSRA